MAVITFKLNDFGIASMANLAPRVYFVPSGPAVIATDPADYLLSSKRIMATLDPDGVTFTVNLFPSSWARPVTTFRMVVEWLDSAGNFISRDAPPWAVFVPESDLPLSEMIDVDQTPFWGFVGSSAPGDPVPGSWWLEDPSGNLYEWED